MATATIAHHDKSASLYDAVIIGGGPAGLSAALVLGRCVRRVAVCDSGRYRNERSGALHCFVSRDGIPPSELLAESRRQLGRYDTITLLPAKVASAGRSGRYFEIVADDGRALQARNLLVATGVVDELPRIEGIDALFGHSVHVCPYCDGWEHRNAAIAVYGRGEKGAGLASLIRQWSDDLVLCTDGEKLPPSEHRRLEGRGVKVREDGIRKLHGEHCSSTPTSTRARPSWSALAAPSTRTVECAAPRRARPAFRASSLRVMSPATRSSPSSRQRKAHARPLPSTSGSSKPTAGSKKRAGP
jgi:thioredoxin reductase